MILLPHHHRVLVALLRSEQFAKLSPDEAYKKLVDDPKHGKNLWGLRSLMFVSEEKAKLFGDKHLAVQKGLLVVVPADEVSRFKDGIPGFPNLLRRTAFDLTWSEATNG